MEPADRPLYSKANAIQVFDIVPRPLRGEYRYAVAHLRLRLRRQCRDEP